jgi:hypothetical protein
VPTESGAGKGKAIVPLKTEHICTECKGERTFQVIKRVPHKETSRRTVSASWWQCMDCWNKFHGTTALDKGILPAGVKPRKGYIE